MVWSPHHPNSIGSAKVATLPMNELPPLVFHGVTGLYVDLAAEEFVGRFLRDPRHFVIVIAETDVCRHAESVGNLLGEIQARLILEVEIDVGRGLVVEAVAHQKASVRRGAERVEEVARGGQPVGR